MHLRSALIPPAILPALLLFAGCSRVARMLEAVKRFGQPGA